VGHVSFGNRSFASDGNVIPIAYFHIHNRYTKLSHFFTTDHKSARRRGELSPLQVISISAGDCLSDKHLCAKDGIAIQQPLVGYALDHIIEETLQSPSPQNEPLNVSIQVEVMDVWQQRTAKERTLDISFQIGAFTDGHRWCKRFMLVLVAAIRCTCPAAS